MPGKTKQKTVHLECTECKNRNYRFYQNKEKRKARVEVNKHCKFCQKHTLHVEAR